MKIIFPNFSSICPPLTIKKLLCKFYEILWTSDEVIKVSKKFNKIKKKTLTKNTKSSFRSKYGKIENYVSKLLLCMSSFDHKEAAVQVLWDSMQTWGSYWSLKKCWGRRRRRKVWSHSLAFGQKWVSCLK